MQSVLGTSKWHKACGHDAAGVRKVHCVKPGRSSAPDSLQGPRRTWMQRYRLPLKCHSLQRQESGAETALQAIWRAAAPAFLSVLATGTLCGCDPALAILNSPSSSIPRTPDAALRRSIPAFNGKVKDMQDEIEEVAYLLRIPQRKPWGTMSNDVKLALDAFQDRAELLRGVPDAAAGQGNEMLDRLYTSLKKLELAVKSQQPEDVSFKVADVLSRVADLELLQAPGLPFILPKEYAALPKLTGRAVVQLSVEAPDGAIAYVDNANGGLIKQGEIEITLDGYSAPVSAGNFLRNVMDGLYNDLPIQVSNTSLVVSSTSPADKAPIPLEILPRGEFDPVYRSTLDVQHGELPVLPLSIPGAVAMTHTQDSESFVSGDNWFVFKFDKQQAGLGGLAFDEGTFGVFGYVTKGMDIVKQLHNGDLIVSAKVVSGADKLSRPDNASGVV